MIYMQTADEVPSPQSPSVQNDSSEDQGTSKRSGDFGKLLVDFMRDLLGTFPELEADLDANLLAVCNGSPSDNTINSVRAHCAARLPERFFDILYQNEDMFSDETADYCFLPGIDFRKLCTANITDKTRSTIWKYLQLFLFDSVSDMTDGSSFGDTAKLFEAIDEDVFRSKLEETITQMQSVFEGGEDRPEDGDEETPDEKPDMPDPNKIHEHVSQMMEGKLGKLAKEIAEETAEEMDIDIDDSGSINDVFKRLFKNPAKLMQLVQNVGTKIDKKLKDGNIKESELIEEATELIKKMKDTPGMGNLQEMFSKMGMPVPQGGKINTAAMQAQLARNMKLAKQRERMQARQASKGAPTADSAITPEEFLEQHRLANEAAAALLKSEGFTGDGTEMFKYSTGDNVEKSGKSSKPKKKKKRKNGK